jgi:hypothetical protein
MCAEFATTRLKTGVSNVETSSTKTPAVKKSMRKELRASDPHTWEVVFTGGRLTIAIDAENLFNQTAFLPKIPLPYGDHRRSAVMHILH